MTDDLTRFEHLSYERFRELARDRSLSVHERIGFPDAYRAGKADLILQDIQSKLPQLTAAKRQVLDIGPGAGELANLLIELCDKQGHTLYLIDSPEMLSLLPERPTVHKIAGRFPAQSAEFIDQLEGQLDVVLTYSVFHYVFEEGNCFNFVDQCLRLLAPGGSLLIGDIPNISMRRRFFATQRGVEFHKAFTQTETEPDVRFNVIQANAIDDAVIISLILRSRASGFDAYCLPQLPELPMSNRREDVLIIRP